MIPIPSRQEERDSEKDMNKEKATRAPQEQGDQGNPPDAIG